ncbi:hypothetical protein [Sphingobium boeckii]|uniref:Cupin domain-containing protein n=1 Tax=Sphingobium boeckii TaxID=1082345 RepID=A0A7W9EFQ2_9SPHN|nr:hypothetical protein [Sphingobium boeckii]MBB5686255.1 hypothetical protein [Sphingobium boeckii]
MEAYCVYVGADGTSKIGRVTLPMMAKIIGEDGASTWTNVQTGRTWGVTGGEGHLPTDDFGPWHTAGNPMMSIVLQGAWEVQAGSGERRVLELGSLTIFLDDTGPGHRSRTVSIEPSIVIGVGLDEKSALDFKTQLGII